MYLSVKMAENDNELVIHHWLPALGWCFFSLSFVLFLSVYFLINRLCKKRDQVATTQADKDFFNGKVRTLLAILVMFSSTYLMRGTWDIISDTKSGSFVNYVVTITIFILCDFVPIIFMLVFHFRNFHNKSAKVTEHERIEE